MRPFLDRVEAGQRLLEGRDLAAMEPDATLALLRAGILREMEGALHEISLPDFARTLRVLYGLRTGGLFTPTTYELGPPMLGWTRGEAIEREVVLVAPTTYGLLNVLIRKRPTLALVPTGQQLTPRMREAHAPGAMVAIEVLEETLVIRDGRITRAQTFAPDAPTLEPPPLAQKPSSPPIARPMAFAPLARWNELRLCLIDGHTVRVDVPGRSQRCTHIDLGMAHPRSREPTRTWEMFVAFCEEHGQFQGTRFGSSDATKKVISRLGKDLRVLFGLTQSPFHPYRRDTGWKSRFDARANVPDET